MKHCEDTDLFTFKWSNERIRTATKKYALQENVFKWPVFPVDLR